LRSGAQIEAAGLEHSLLELVKMRSSQLNGCAYCLEACGHGPGMFKQLFKTA